MSVCSKNRPTNFCTQFAEVYFLLLQELVATYLVLQTGFFAHCFNVRVVLKCFGVLVIYKVQIAKRFTYPKVH